MARVGVVGYSRERWIEDGIGMVEAFLLINAAVGRSVSIADEIAQIEGVARADVVTGPFDVIVRAQAPTIDDLGRLILRKVQGVTGVSRTMTCPILRR